MTSVEAYKRLLLKINKNDSNADIDISKGEFVLLYNEQKDRWLLEKISDKQSTDDIQDLERVQKKHFPLKLVKRTEQYDTFSLPQDYFSYISSYTIASDKNCSDIIIRNYPFKPKNENTLLENANAEPSLDFEETIVDLSESKLFVYKKDFDIEKVFLNYYREVGVIDIEGYIKLDGTSSTNINPDLHDVDVDEILNRCAKEIIRRYENPDGFQLADERIKSSE